MDKCRIKILYIEDDEDDILLVKDYLEDIKPGKYHLDHINSFSDAICNFEKYGFLNEYDVFLIDYKIGPENGLDLAMIIKSKIEDKPIIMITGFPDFEKSTNLLSEGISDYLVKGEISASSLERSIRYSLLRMDLECSLKYKKELLRSIYNTIPSGICLINNEGKIEELNQAFLDIFDLKCETMAEYNHNFDLILKFKKFIDKCNYKETKDLSLDEIIFSIKKPIEGRFVCVSGKEVDVLLSCSSVFLKKEKEYSNYVLITVVDITKQKLAEINLSIMNKSLEEKIEKFGIKNSNPEAMLDLIENEINKFSIMG